MGASPAQRLLVQSLPPRSVALTQVSAQSSQKQRQQERPHRGVSTGWDWAAASTRCLYMAGVPAGVKPSNLAGAEFGVAGLA